MLVYLGTAMPPVWGLQGKHTGLQQRPASRFTNVVKSTSKELYLMSFSGN